MRRFAQGLSSAFAGLRLALGNAEVRLAYIRVVAAILLFTMILNAAALWLVWAPVLETTNEGLGWDLLLRIPLTLVVLLISPFVALIATNLLFPLFNMALFMAGLRIVAPERAVQLSSQPGIGLRASATCSLIRLLLFLAMAGLAFGMSLLPVVGWILGPVAQVYVSARALSWELLDPYFDKLGYGYARQKVFIRRHRSPLLGFGLPYALVFAIPLLGPLIFGFAQASAAVLVTRAIEVDGLPHEMPRNA
ncbi:MAG: EI24 domain-containing protein [Nannocystaceae bacterium]